MYQQVARWIRRVIASLSARVALIGGQVPVSGSGTFRANETLTIPVMRPTGAITRLSATAAPVLYLGSQITGGVVTATLVDSVGAVTIPSQVNGLAAGTSVVLVPVSATPEIVGGLSLVLVSTSGGDAGGLVSVVALVSFGVV